MKFFGLELVPFDEPLENRLQVLASGALFFIVAVLGLTTAPLSVYLLFTRVWWVVLLYYIWLYLDRKTSHTGGRPSFWLLSSQWFNIINKYFEAKLVLSNNFKLSQDKNYLFCCSPHGVIPSGPFCNIVNHSSNFHKLFPKFQVTFSVINMTFFLPLVRDFMLAIGAISSSAESINHLLNHPKGGKIVVLYPGGAAEAFYAIPGTYRFLLSKRKGFIKLALKNGVSIVPIITFNENDLYEQHQGSTIKMCQDFFKKITGFTPILFLGRGFFQTSFGFAPKQARITTVVGDPIEVPKNESPSVEEIEKLHGVFVKSLQDLFEKYKKMYSKNGDKAVLQII